MYQLYKLLKGRSTLPTDEELLIAARKKVLNPKATSEYLQKLENTSNTIVQAFNQQNLKNAICFHIIYFTLILIVFKGQYMGPTKV
jgi:hypothetical protein